MVGMVAPWANIRVTGRASRPLMGVYAANYAVSHGFSGRLAGCLSSSTAGAAYARFYTSRPCLAGDATLLLTLVVTVDVRKLIQVMHLPDIRDYC